MIDPRTSLAFSIYSQKGVYALLLGSGVSRAAGIPTGWEVVLDLIKKLAAAEAEDPGTDLERWFKQKYGQDPDYSNLLDHLTKSSSERMALLRSYFEPTDEERAHGLKLPTRAHHAIAQLIKEGFIRVVVTTNFDRLLELALEEKGVRPVVLSTPEAVQGCVPLQHNVCTVLKLHGDYLDTRLRNTSSELEAYDEATNALLDRIFDEYGLLICGWSGEWDTALRKALTRCKSRRFGTYWCAKDPLSSVSQDLARHRQATIIEISSADDFFSDLADRVSALVRIDEQSHPLSGKVAVARLKRYISDKRWIELRDLLAGETESAYKELVRTTSGDVQSQTVESEIPRRIEAYRKQLDLLLNLFVQAVYYSQSEFHNHILSTLKRIGQLSARKGGDQVLITLQRYPGLLLLYGFGLAAIASGNYQFLGTVLQTKVRTANSSDQEPAATALSIWRVQGTTEAWRALPGLRQRYTPASDHLLQVLREPLIDFFPDETEYEEIFDWWEYLLSLGMIAIRYSVSELEQKISYSNEPFVRVPVTRFVWRQRHRDNDIAWETRVQSEDALPEKAIWALNTGLFGVDRPLSIEYFTLAKTALDNFVQKVRSSYCI